MPIMQKDLLAELHLPKLNLKTLGHIVINNSKRLACVIKDNNEFIKNSKEIPPDLKVVMGNKFSGIDVNFALSTSVENIETIKRKYVIKKASYPVEIPVENGVEKSPGAAVTDSTTATHKDSATEDKVECDEIRPPPARESHTNSTISPTEASLEICPVESAGTEPLMSAVASSVSDEDPEVQILLDKNPIKYSGVGPTSSRSLLKQYLTVSEPIVKPPAEENIVSSTTKDDECETSTDTAESSTPAMCIISEVVGNAHSAFGEAEDSEEKVDESQESQIITPKKTNDITKIKGWRRKQFFVEKPTTVEFYSVSDGYRRLKKKIELRDYLELSEEPGNKENAFVCDSLDEFLDQEANLKVGHEVPHLFAEFGIKLTGDEIVSRPIISEKDLEEVETRYCVPISLPCDSTNLDNIKVEVEESDFKGVKRPTEDDIKPCKMLKFEGYRRQKFMDHFKNESPANFPVSESKVGVQKTECRLIKAYQNLDNIKLLTKLIALVVYPGPHRPLHPVVQYHLNKLRTYRTAVDENWANFAASAVVVNDNRRKRQILPAYCCVRVPKNQTDTNEQTVKTKRNISKEQIKLKECRVVVKRLKPSQISDPWCMEHNRYNCSRCGLTRTKPIRSQVQLHSVRELHKNFRKRWDEDDEEEQGETVTVSPRAIFNKKIARLLAKKVRLLKANGDTLTSIDSLRAIKLDTVEFIKLKFVKESFHAGHIHIWYLEPVSATVRSRAFLTFSPTSPMPNAINLKSTDLCFKNLPKVITEIVSAENTFDSNEYAILHCNGGVWEIHGSLNITFGSSDKYVEQIFTSLELPELSSLQDLAQSILQVKAVKWWVLDLTQKFKLMELQSGNYSTAVTRKKFLGLIKANAFGFIALRRDYEQRLIGVYLVQRLLPFVLLGPYYLLESRNVILKSSTGTIPFRYIGEENVTTNYPLKFFINSVIKNLENTKNKKLEGLWLYDKMCLDKTSYIEVVASEMDSQLSCKESIINIEHGYSLNSLTHSSSSGATSGIVRRDDGKDELQTVTVYLYFDIFQLGYLEGELQFDNSVLINHPLDKRTKMKSHKIGDWFLSIIRRRVVFCPENLAVRWFVTKHKEDLRDRAPFNKFILGGAHIVTRNGVYYLLELSEMKIERLGLDKNQIMKIMSQCEVLNEVWELKKMAKLLMSDSDKTLPMDGVLTKATDEINALNTLNKYLEENKAMVRSRKFTLAVRFLRLVDSLNIRRRPKIEMIEILENLFLGKNGQLDESFVKVLRESCIGREYLKHFETRRSNLNSSGKAEKVKFLSRISELGKRGSLKSASVERLLASLKQLSEDYQYRNISALSDCHSSGDTITATKRHRALKQFRFLRKLHPVSDRIFKVAQAEESKTANAVKVSWQLTNAAGQKEKHSKFVVLPKLQKPKDTVVGFQKLGSSDLQSAIRSCWRNWNIKTLEVT